VVAQGANNKNVGAANNEIMPPQLGLGAEADEEKVVAEDVETTEAMEEGGGGQREATVAAAKPAAAAEGAARSKGEKDGGGASENEEEEEVTVSIVTMPGVSLGAGKGGGAGPLEMARTRVPVNESVAGLMGRLLLPPPLACQLELSFMGQVLDRSRSVGSYGIVHGDVLLLTHKTAGDVLLLTQKTASTGDAFSSLPCAGGGGGGGGGGGWWGGGGGDGGCFGHWALGRWCG